ncbi:putative capsid protein [Odonata-associated circular virus-4]|uniref:putative capsid protein n=1 Tax=Odonata-associated circular virus-4 TaxID=1592124 RepID=UPI000585F30D|nr:putative capsid protein [Odonata-associated circular virus-4]AJD07506.1 putative capsid protein [Odonata-associated circular virus-4]
MVYRRANGGVSYRRRRLRSSRVRRSTSRAKYSRRMRRRRSGRYGYRRAGGSGYGFRVRSRGGLPTRLTTRWSTVYTYPDGFEHIDKWIEVVTSQTAPTGMENFFREFKPLYAEVYVRRWRAVGADLQIVSTSEGFRLLSSVTIMLGIFRIVLVFRFSILVSVPKLSRFLSTGWVGGIVKQKSYRLAYFSDKDAVPDKATAQPYAASAPWMPMGSTWGWKLGCLHSNLEWKVFDANSFEFVAKFHWAFRGRKPLGVDTDYNGYIEGDVVIPTLDHDPN